MDWKLFALHGCWCTADAVKHVVGTKISPPGNVNIPSQIEEAGQLGSMSMRLYVWYALLYVVVEGYRELDLKDSYIDELLAQQDFVEMLRRFRNAVFHFQEDALSPKLRTFLEAEGSENWIHELHRALGAFFTQVLPIEEWLKRIAYFPDP